MAAANAYCKAEERKRTYTYTNEPSGSNGNVTSSYMEQMPGYHRIEDDDDAVRNGSGTLLVVFVMMFYSFVLVTVCSNIL